MESKDSQCCRARENQFLNRYSSFSHLLNLVKGHNKENDTIKRRTSLFVSGISLN